MKRIFLIITAFIFIQCDPFFEGYWDVAINNNSNRKIIFGIDVNIVNGKIYARESYYDPSDGFLDFTQEFRPQSKDHYSFLSKSSRRQFVRSKVCIINGDTVFVYAFDPVDLDMYTWDEIREKKKYWFARVVIHRGGDGCIYFPFELNE